MATKHDRCLKNPNWQESDQLVIHIGITRAYRETTTANWSERDMHPRPQEFKSGAITTEPQVDHLRYIKFSLAARLRGKKTKENERPCLFNSFVCVL